MADYISAVASSASAKPTQFIQLENPANAPGKADPSGLSEAARSALSSVGDMQSELQSTLESARNQRVADLSDTQGASGQGSTSDTLAEATRTIQTQMEVAVRVQHQLTRFVMVSSVSSSFGRNLNMFLRGQ